MNDFIEVKQNNQLNSVLGEIKGVNWSDPRRSEPEDITNRLVELNHSLSEVVGIKEQSELLVLESGETLVLLADEPLEIDTAEGSPKEILMLISDGLVLTAENKEYIFKIKERAKGGSQLEVSATDGQYFYIFETTDPEMSRQAYNLNWSINPKDSIEARRLWDQSHRSYNLTKVILHPPVADNTKTTFAGMDNGFRVKDVKGGLMKLGVWGKLNIRGKAI